jgi:hypothetical protein
MNYILKNYEKGFESDQARIGIEVTKKWLWPYAYDEEDLLKIHAHPNFDPDTRIYCFLDGKMVGCMYALIKPVGEDGTPSAYLDFPRMVPDHEHEAYLLIEKMIKTLQQKGISHLFGHVTTMVPGDIQLAKDLGFEIKDLGFKVYYSYEMAQGYLYFPAEQAKEIDPVHDLERCAEIATRWYGRDKNWCLNLLEEWHARGIITHQGVWRDGSLVAACMTAPNVLRASTAAIYYIYTPNEELLKPMLVNVVNRCIEHGAINVIADLIGDHKQYESTYRQLGFKKVAEWAKWEKVLEQ